MLCVFFCLDNAILYPNSALHSLWPLNELTNTLLKYSITMTTLLFQKWSIEIRKIPSIKCSIKVNYYQMQYQKFLIHIQGLLCRKYQHPTKLRKQIYWCRAPAFLLYFAIFSQSAEGTSGLGVSAGFIALCVQPGVQSDARVCGRLSGASGHRWWEG